MGALLNMNLDIYRHILRPVSEDPGGGCTETASGPRTILGRETNTCVYSNIAAEHQLYFLLSSWGNRQTCHLTGDTAGYDPEAQVSGYHTCI